MLDFIFNIAAKVIPHRDIVIDDELYLRRFFLTPRSWKTRVFLHHIRKSDAGIFLHDHPWDFTSYVLWGSYVELLKTAVVSPYELTEAGGGRRRHRWLSRHRYKAEDAHLVNAKKQVVTLCFVKQARRVWGFFPPEGWEDWRKHLGLPADVEVPAEDVVRNGSKMTH
jgi:hypothetical protein